MIGLNAQDWSAHTATVSPMARDDIVGYDWQPDCPIHGLKSVWYSTTGKSHLDATSRESVRLQGLARKARTAGRAVCKECEEFQDDCVCVLPCPFCGGKGYMVKTLRAGYELWMDDPDAYAYHVCCRSCAAEGPWAKSNEKSAFRQWNHRV